VGFREEINEYDLGLPVPIAPIEERRRAIPPRVWKLLYEAKARVGALLGDRLREVRLFGSYARGQFNDDSDVDVLVVPTSLEPGERARLVDSVCSVSTDDLLISPIILTEAQLEDLRRREVLLVSDLDREGLEV
jgi:uncharacterized protein